MKTRLKSTAAAAAKIALWALVVGVVLAVFSAAVLAVAALA